MKTFGIFDAHGADSELNNRSGQRMEVLRRLTSDEVDINEVGQMFKVRFSDGFETDVFEDEITDPMGRIKAAMLPGFYTDYRGAYGIIVGSVYISCFMNDEDGKFDVTADTVDVKGDFALNIDWESYDKPEDAVNGLRQLIKKYIYRRVKNYG